MKITQELLDKYYLGDCSEEEKKAVEQWIASDNTGETESPSLPSHIDLQGMEDGEWNAFSRKFPDIFDQRRKSKRKVWKLLSVAACLALVVAFSLYVVLRPPRTSVVETYREYSVVHGKKVSLTLNDGSRVYLNSGSTIRYPAQFHGAVRHVQLSGEAYFEVAADPDKPFLIETPESRVRVLGTKFNLKDYTGEQGVTLAVTEGRVSFARGGEEDGLVLEAGQLATLGPDGAIARRHASVRDASAWKANRLVFKQASLGEIALILERWYGVEVFIERKTLGEQLYTGEFDNPSLEGVLKSLAFAIKFEYRKKGKTVILK